MNSKKKLSSYLATYTAKERRYLLAEMNLTSEEEVSLKHLHKLVSSKRADPRARELACSLILHIGNKRSTGILLEAFDDEDHSVSHMATLALIAITSDSALEFLIGVLRSSLSETKRTNAAYILGIYYEDERATDALIDALNDKKQAIETRAQAAESLGALSATRATETLVANLQESSLEIRYRCIAALGEVGMDAAVIPVLETFLSDESIFQGSAIREKACDAIRIIKARVLALEQYAGDKSTADIWTIHEETMALREHIECD